MPNENSYGDMDEESGLDAAAPSTAQAEQDEAPETQHEEDGKESDEGSTALLPKSLFGGEVKPGTICQVKIEHCYEDECEVSWVKEGAASKPKSNMEESEGALDKMAMKG